MAVPAFSFAWKNYDCYNEEDLKKFEDLITKEFSILLETRFSLQNIQRLRTLKLLGIIVKKIGKTKGLMNFI